MPVFCVVTTLKSLTFAYETFKFATLLVLCTLNGAPVTVAILDINCGLVTLALANTCAVPKLPKLALPEVVITPLPVSNVPATLTPVPVTVIMFALPATPIVIFPFVVLISTLLVPFAIELAAPFNLPIK